MLATIVGSACVCGNKVIESMPMIENVMRKSVSLVYRQLPRNNTRRRRVVLGFVHVCVLMASVTAFYPLPEYNLALNRVDESDKFTFEWEEISVGVISAIIAFSSNCVLFWIAKNVAPVQSYTTDYSSR